MSDEDDLKQWASDCNDELGMPHENEAFLKLVLLASVLGYKYAAYGMEYPSSIVRPLFTFYANYASNWHQTFIERHIEHHGSRVAYGKRTIDPDYNSNIHYWRRSDFHREAKANNIQFDIFETFDTKAGTISMIALSGAASMNDLAIQKTRILIDTVVQKMEELLIKKNLSHAYIKLSDLERTYLQWVLEGKTSKDIADIMGVRKSAIDNMQRSLPDTFDRTGIFATAFYAYRLGLLDNQ